MAENAIHMYRRGIPMQDIQNKVYMCQPLPPPTIPTKDFPSHLPNRTDVTDTNREEKAHVYLDAIIDLIRLTLKFVGFGHQDIVSFFLPSTHQEPIAVILHAIYSRNNQIKLVILHPVNQ